MMVELKPFHGNYASCILLLILLTLDVHVFVSLYTVQFFDKIDIGDPRIPEFCSKTTLPNPSQILDECLKR